jgi:hypothetical protein
MTDNSSELVELSLISHPCGVVTSVDAGPSIAAIG